MSIFVKYFSKRPASCLKAFHSLVHENEIDRNVYLQVLATVVVQPN